MIELGRHKASRECQLSFWTLLNPPPHPSLSRPSRLAGLQVGAAAGAAAAPTFEGDDDMTLDEPQQSGDEEDLTHTGIANDDDHHHHHHTQQVRACMRGGVG